MFGDLSVRFASVVPGQTGSLILPLARRLGHLGYSTRLSIASTVHRLHGTQNMCARVRLPLTVATAEIMHQVLSLGKGSHRTFCCVLFQAQRACFIRCCFIGRVKEGRRGNGFVVEGGE